MVARVHGGGPIEVSGGQDDDFHREFTAKYLINCATTDGPYTVMNAPGLPTPGSPWRFKNEIDIWAWCKPGRKVAPVYDREPLQWYTVECGFSTKPINRCNDKAVENPLLEPIKVSGGFQKYTEEAYYDRFGRPIVSSSWEMLRGSQNEWDANRPSLRVEQNILSLGWHITAAMMDNVNAIPMWGMPRRTIKLSNASFERKYYGQCLAYYTRTLEFDFRFEGFDRDLYDTGYNVLRGHWGSVRMNDGRVLTKWVRDSIGKNDNGSPIYPNKNNPAHFVRFQDQQGNYMKTILDGYGMPYDPDPDYVATCTQCPTGAPVRWHLSGFNPLGKQVAGGVAALAAGGQLAGALVAAAGVVGVGAINQARNVTLERVPDLLQGPTSCSWIGFVDNNLLQEGFRLDYDAARTRWTLTSSLPNIGPWDLDANKWQCFGPNVMIHDPNILRDESTPERVTLTGEGIKNPGVRHVEKYPESNLMLLGLPPFLWS